MKVKQCDLKYIGTNFSHYPMDGKPEIAFAGKSNVGKSTLIKSIVGQIPFIKGEARFGANVEVGYYDQTQSKLTPHNSVLDELWNDFKLTPEVEIRNRLGAFLFSGDDVKKTVGMLSGGERARLLLAKLSMENNNFLILDEPTNGLDPVGIHEIRTLIRSLPQKYDCTVLVSSHLLPEVELMADDIGILNHGHLLFEGTKEELKTSARAAGFPTDNLEDTFLAMIDEDNRRRGGTV